MKAPTTYSNFIFRIYLPILISLAILVIIALPLLIYTTSISYVFLFFILFLFFSPKGSLILGDPKQKSWLNIPKLFLFQISVALILFAIIYSFFHITNNQNLPDLYLNSLLLKQIIFSWGFFPVTLYALLSCTLAYYYQKSPISLANIIKPLVKNIHGVWYQGTKIFTRQSLIFFIGFSLAAPILLLYTTFNNFSGLNLSQQNLNLYTLVCFTLVYGFTQSEFWKKRLGYFWRRNMPINHLVLLHTLALIILLLIVNIITQLFLSYLDIPSNPVITYHLSLQQWQNLWSLLIWGVLLSAAPLIASVSVLFLQGYSVRQALILWLFPPIIGITLMYQIKFALFTNPWLIWIMVSAGFILLFAFYYFSKVVVQEILLVIKTNLPSGSFKPPLKTVQAILQIVTVLTLLSLLGGLPLISFFYFSITATTVVAFVLVTISFVKKEM